MRGPGNRHSLYSSATDDLGEPVLNCTGAAVSLSKSRMVKKQKRPAVHHERSRGCTAWTTGTGPNDSMMQPTTGQTVPTRR
jgi:hypothetical protein